VLWQLQLGLWQRAKGQGTTARRIIITNQLKKKVRLPPVDLVKYTSGIGEPIYEKKN
jgi:hypothetical protein